MLSCLVVAGSLFLSGPYEAVRLDEVQQMKLIGRDLTVYGSDISETFHVTASEAEKRPAQIVADCAERAEVEETRRYLAAQSEALTGAVAAKPAIPVILVEPAHTPTPLEAECEAEHYKYGARDTDMVREICAGARTDPAVPAEE